MTKYIPCTHCTVQKCKDCDYELHKKAVGMIREYKDNILSLQNHFLESEQNKESILDYKTMTAISEALKLVE